MRSKVWVAISVGLLWLGVGIVLFSWPREAYPQAQPYPQQCVTNVAAGGTVNAITSQAIPCGFTTNIVLLTATGTNTGGVTYQPLGLPAQNVLRGNGQPLAAGDIAGAGYVALLTPTGSNWVLLNPATIGLNSIPASDVAFTPAGGPLTVINLQTRGTFQSFAGDYAASGSAATTTASTQSGSNQITLANGVGFGQGEGILVQSAGAPSSLTAPTFSITVEGSTGSTKYCYDVSLADANGGYSAPTQHCITNGNATLGTVNYNQLTITIGTAKAALVWESPTGTGSWTYIGSIDTTTFADTGYRSATLPWWIGATPAAQNDWLVSTISNIQGNVVTVAATAGSTQTSVYAQHDDTAAINFGLQSVNSGITQLILPCGTYNTSSALTFGGSYTGLIGYGPCTNIVPSGVSNDFNITTAPASPYVGDYIQSLMVTDTAKAAGLGLITNSTSNLVLSNLTWNNPYSGLQIKNFSSFNAYNINVNSFFGQDGYIMGLISDATHSSSNSDTVDIYGTGIGGGVGDGSQAAKGFWVDGNVSHTVSHNWFAGNISGPGFLQSDIVGNAASPTVAQIDRFRADHTNGRGVDLEAGTGPDFTGILLSNTNFNTFSSCAASAGFYVASGVSFFGIEGGVLSTSSGDGIYVNGTEGVLKPTTVNSNSATSSGGTAGTCPGIEFGANSAYATLVGAIVGDQINTTYQAEPVLIDSGGVDLVIVGNVFAGNVSNTVSDSSGSNTNQYALNSGDTAYSLEVSPNGSLNGKTVYSTGSAPMPTGTCSVNTQQGGQFAGTFKANGACVSGTVILTFSTAAAHGWSCTAKDISTPTDSMNPTSYGTTSVTFTGSMANSDVVTFTCVGF